MQIVSAYLLAASVNAGYRGNLLTNDQLNMNNWSIEDQMTIEYVNGVNQVTFSNTGGGGSSFEDALTQDLYSRYNITFVAGAIASIKSYWDTNNRVAFARPIGGGRVQFWVGNYNSVTSSAIVVNPTNYIIYNNGDVSTVNNQVSSYYSEYPTQHYYGTFAEYGHSIAGYAGKIWLDVPVENGKLYEFVFKCCTPSGFVYGSQIDGCVSVVSGVNSGTVLVENEASEDMLIYRISFIAGDDTATITFDLSEMTSNSEVELDVGSLALYEVG